MGKSENSDSIPDGLVSKIGDIFEVKKGLHTLFQKTLHLKSGMSHFERYPFITFVRSLTVYAKKSRSVMHLL